jgi:signal transduction histidine kinase
LFERAIALALAVLGVVVLFGWWLGADRMRAPLAGAPAMVPNTAVMFLLSGVALAWRGRVRRAAALGILVIAGAAAAEYLTAIDLGVDRLLARAAPGPPSPNTVVAFLLLASALLVPAARGHGRSTLVEAFSLIAATIAAIALLGYGVGLVFFAAPWRLPPSIGMAPHTAAGLLVLSVGVLAARPDAALTALMASDAAGGVMVRRLLLVALVTIPLTVIGAFTLQQRGWWPAPGAAVVAAVVSLVVIVLALRLTGRRIDAAEALRAHLAERAAQLHELETVQRARLESIMAQMPVGVVVVDADGQLALQNSASLALARSIEPLVHDVHRPTGETLPIPEFPVMRALRGESIASEELFVVLASGERVPILASAVPVRAGDQIIGAVAAFRDIRTLKELERLREEWASIIAHDMRQPVHGIWLNADLLKRAALTEREQATLGRIRRAAERLERMIVDLLDVSRIEAKRLELRPQPMTLAAVLHDAVAESRVADRARLAIDAPDVVVRADQARLMQVLENLLSNAAKYGDPESPVVVRLEREHDHVVVSIENRGPGIPADELPALFERFSRTRAAQDGLVAGLGLGLYICRGLVEAHGGRIWAESEPGGITAFRFTLPVAGALTSAPTAPDGSAAAPGR